MWYSNARIRTDCVFQKQKGPGAELPLLPVQCEVSVGSLSSALSKYKYILTTCCYRNAGGTEDATDGAHTGLNLMPWLEQLIIYVGDQVV